jgi:hypothetical protein
MKKLLIAMLTLLSISACGKYWYKPYGKIFNHGPKDGTPGYRTGWEHGCESGLATQFGSAFFMAFYSWKRDENLTISKPDMDLVKETYEKEWDIDWNDLEEVKTNIRHYNKVFWLGHIFCRHSIVGTYQMAGSAHGKSMDPPLPGEQRYVPGAHSLGNIYSFHGRGNSHLSYW